MYMCKKLANGVDMDTAMPVIIINNCYFYVVVTWHVKARQMWIFVIRHFVSANKRRMPDAFVLF